MSEEVGSKILFALQGLTAASAASTLIPGCFFLAGFTA